MTPESLIELSGTPLAIGVLVFVTYYFMNRDKDRERFVSDVLQKNTDALNNVATAVDKLSDIVVDFEHQKNGYFKGKVA